MYITAFFTENGTPKAGLSAIIRIRRVSDNALVITDDGMTEVGDGWYKYDYAAYDEEIDYAIRCDGGSPLTSPDRFKYAGNENYIDDIDAKLTTEHGSGSWSVSDGTNSVDARIDRILGLSQENYYVDNTTFDGNRNMLTSRVRVYSDSASVGSTSNVLVTYSMTATYNSSSELLSYKMEKI